MASVWWGAEPLQGTSTQSLMENAPRGRSGIRGVKKGKHKGEENEERDIVKDTVHSFFPPPTISHWANPPKAIVRELGNVA